jgi:2-keto-4-pentenoate hydratase
VTEDEIQVAAGALATAESMRRPIEPLTATYPTVNVDHAYAIQLRNAERRTRKGERIRGHKIGLTAPVMQEAFGVDEPDYGHLFDSMFIADGGAIDLGDLIAPKVEVEPAFILKQDLSGPGVTAQDVMDALDRVVPCLEIIDSRITDWRIKLEDTVADNGSSAAVVLGDQPVEVDAELLANADVELADGQAVIERGNTREILGHPATAVAWLVNALASFGVSVRAGHVVLPGTCTLARPLWRGTVRGSIAGIGSVTASVL